MIGMPRAGRRYRMKERRAMDWGVLGKFAVAFVVLGVAIWIYFLWSREVE